MNMTLRNVLQNHRAFLTDDSAFKVVQMVIENISKKWTMPIRDERPALNQFEIAEESLHCLKRIELCKILKRIGLRKTLKSLRLF